jgi:diacylglycerol kinase family enzyme
MYYYVYDEFIQDAKFERELANIETRLTDLGIQGKTARLALFRDPEEMIRDEVRKGVKTVIAVGNDQTLRKVIDSVASLGATLGVIPLGKSNNQIAEMIGIPTGVAACDALSARIIEEMDAGIINSGRFLHKVEVILKEDVKILHNDGYSIFAPKGTVVQIRNLAKADDVVGVAHPADGKLELVMKTPISGWFGKKAWELSFIKFTKISIECNQEMQADVDGQIFKGKTFRVEVIPRQIRMITGKSRQFVSEG